MPEVEELGERERTGTMDVGAKCAVDFLTFLERWKRAARISMG